MSCEAPYLLAHPLKMTRLGDHSALIHLSALNNKINYCIHVHVYAILKPLCIFKTGRFGFMSIVVALFKINILRTKYHCFKH